ncbi:hypothetical protein X560_0235 [Listeria fleischmannii 1991]|uniref:NADH-flavin reductase n=2 Tax=Listeria fleischmannii TaxID=1069827 RepID=A0A2X3H2S2_9LIST|nr:SDR family oxidoreductase [Listeria fleischmannii]EMG28898.1 NAD-dependent epimerase/dehydratase [Listeria fleischmannii subsp. fleischmannii LU2006-1]KMT61168.1 hypothetical protein X560_0235 [Listeria fleischmannii 1991]SQC64995.1 Putative NADH-flavin reductase [Listeria fleischmannii subsp. fleischmannii]
MKIFVTGGTGNIGSAVVQNLIANDHEVIGLARSKESEQLLQKNGAEVYRGELTDLTDLSQLAKSVDGVIHLAFMNGITDMERSLRIDLEFIRKMGKALEKTNKPFVITNHVNGDKSIDALFALTGVRSAVVSLPPTVHGNEDIHGFIPTLIQIAKKTNYAAFVGKGENRWPAVHRLDAANLYRLAVLNAEAGSFLSGRAEEGIPFIDIATTIGNQLNIPTKSVTNKEAKELFGFLGELVALDLPSVAPETTELSRSLGWGPKERSLLIDMQQGHYFK